MYEPGKPVWIASAPNMQFEAKVVEFQEGASTYIVEDLYGETLIIHKDYVYPLPETPQIVDTRIWSELQSFEALRSSGILWLINTTVFHPRGMALAIELDDEGDCIGWKLCTDNEAWVFTDTEANIGFDSFEMFIAKIQNER